MIFAHYQYPVIDLRYFLKKEYRKNLPLFPLPNRGMWLRNFGHVRNRAYNTSPYFLADSSYCDGHNAVKFEELPLFIGKKEYERHYQVCDWMDFPIIDTVAQFRRFQSDGNLRASYNIGFNFSKVFHSLEYYHTDYTNLSCKVKNTMGNYTQTTLAEVGIPIVKLYESSTEAKKTPFQTVFSGKPTYVYVDYDAETDTDEAWNRIKHREFENFKINLYHYETYRGVCWIIRPWTGRTKTNKKMVAAIRRAIHHIGLEKELIIAAYNFLHNNYGSKYIDQEKVIHFIKDTQEKLFRQVRFEIPQNPIVDVLFKIDFKENKSTYSNITEIISKIGDKYIMNDFNKLYIAVDFRETRQKLQNELNKSNDKELNKKLIQLRNICISENTDAFWAFVYKYKLDVISLNVFSNWLFEYIKRIWTLL